jgi:predicted TIM-barrel fold metal-dependent hydrolase
MPLNPDTKPIPLCDPHFHLWDLHNRPNLNLGEAAGHPLPVYEATDYHRDMGALPERLQLVSGVHVETIVGQMEGGALLDTVDETRWVCDQLEPSEAQFPFGMVAYVHLSQSAAERARTLEQHIETSGGRLCGVRMILNHHPENPGLTWPQVEHGDFMSSDRFREGIALLGPHNLSFDLSCNPHQIMDAVDTFRAFPEVRVVINHLGFIHDGDDQAHEDLWRKGMHALAALPNMYIKLSMLWFARNGFHQDTDKEAKVRSLVREVIDIFGTDRCMFASNYPVDKFNEISMGTLYRLFLSWTEDLSVTDQTALFHDTAVQAYNLG